MKELKFLFIFLMLLPLIVSAAALPFLPPEIPVHFDASGIADRWGNRFEALAVPSASLICGFIILYFVKQCRPRGSEGRTQAAAFYITGLCLFLVFNIMSFYYLAVYLREISDLSLMKIEITQLICSVFGFCSLAAAFILPGKKLENLLPPGFSWSERKEAVWLESRGRLALCLFANGALMLAICAFTKAIFCLFLCLLTFSAFFIMFSIYSRKVKKKIR